MNQLSHLPEDKRREILAAIAVIKDVAPVAKIILYGSFASNDWVDDIDIVHGAELDYRSDYDFLVILEQIDEKDYNIKSKIVNRTKSFRHRVSPMVRSISYVNYGLETGQFFFKEIVEKGITLFDNGNTAFSPSRPLTTEEQRELANDYFRSYIKGGSRLLRIVKISLPDFLEDQEELKELLFVLRQSFESFYAGLSLIFRGYKPKNHDLDELRDLTKVISDDLNFVFVTSDEKEDYRLYRLLDRSYIDARYSLHYTLDSNDLINLIEKAEKLQRISLRLSEERLKSLR